MVIFDLVVFDLVMFDPFTVCDDASCVCIVLICAINGVVSLVFPPSCTPPCMHPRQPSLLVFNLLLMTARMDSYTAFANSAMAVANMVFKSSTWFALCWHVSLPSPAADWNARQRVLSASVNICLNLDHVFLVGDMVFHLSTARRMILPPWCSIWSRCVAVSDM